MKIALFTWILNTKEFFFFNFEYFNLNFYLNLLNTYYASFEPVEFCWKNIIELLIQEVEPQQPIWHQM